MALHNEIGHLGEDATCEYLKKNGYKIVERNWRLGNIEIDVIAEDRRNIVFVEVKTTPHRRNMWMSTNAGS